MFLNHLELHCVCLFAVSQQNYYAAYCKILNLVER